MFSDPQSVTINAVPVSLPRVSTGDMKGRFRNADGSLELAISHSASRRERSVIRLDRSKIGVDPLDPTKNKSYTCSVYLVVDAPLNGVGFTDAELEYDVKGLTALINSAGFCAKFLGKEA